MPASFTALGKLEGIVAASRVLPSLIISKRVARSILYSKLRERDSGCVQALLSRERNPSTESSLYSERDNSLRTASPSVTTKSLSCESSSPCCCISILAHKNSSTHIQLIKSLAALLTSS
ncbi:hypothetical protein D3C77_590260 [compost metagenome]